MMSGRGRSRKGRRGKGRSRSEGGGWREESPDVEVPRDWIVSVPDTRGECGEFQTRRSRTVAARDLTRDDAKHSVAERSSYNRDGK